VKHRGASLRQQSYFWCHLAQVVFRATVWNDRGQEVKGHGCTRPKTDLGAWRRHHSRHPWVEYCTGFLVFILLSSEYTEHILHTSSWFQAHLWSVCYKKLSYRRQIATTRRDLSLGQGSLKVIGNSTIRYIAYEFVLAFRSNYGAILYRLWDIYSELLVESR